MNIYWKKVEGGATQEFAEIEDYIDESVPVWLPNPRKKEEQWMFPGKKISKIRKSAKKVYHVGIWNSTTETCVATES